MSSERLVLTTQQQQHPRFPQSDPQQWGGVSQGGGGLTLTEAWVGELGSEEELEVEELTAGSEDGGGVAGVQEVTVPS